MLGVKGIDLSIEDRIEKVLEDVKADPKLAANNGDCDSSVLEYLLDHGYINAAVYTLQSGEKEFANLKITTQGELYLESKKSPPSTAEQSTPSWHSNPVILTILGVVGTVVAAGVIYWLGWV